MCGIKQSDPAWARESMHDKLSEFRTPDIIIVLTNIVILVVDGCNNFGGKMLKLLILDYHGLHNLPLIVPTVVP